MKTDLDMRPEKRYAMLIPDKVPYLFSYSTIPDLDDVFK